MKTPIVSAAINPNHNVSRLFSLLTLFALTAALFPASAMRTSAQSDCQTFKETGKTVCGRFLEYWNQNGGLAQQGYPISDAKDEKSDTNGKIYLTQYFERAVFEMHPENQKPFDVLLSLLGVFEYKDRYGSAGAPNQKTSTDNPLKFDQTGKTVGGKFRTYWEKNGGLPQQGYPISNEFSEKSALDGKTYTVQYFERAVFEAHPENQPPYDVLLSQLGKFRWDDKNTPKINYPGGSANLTGSGATFPLPLISKWSQEYNKLYSGVKVNYAGGGSGKGRTDFINKTVDFAASDALLSDQQFAQAGGPDKAMHIPWVMGGVVMAYNLPGVSTQLKLTGPVIADIYMLKIKNWNDPAITALNSGVTLPNTPIVVVHRSDSSGTTDIFTDYLSKTSDAWKNTPGLGHSGLPNWPGGLGAQGNDGVTNQVKLLSGAIGYIEVSFAKNNNLPNALIKNKAGNYVDATSANVSDAADSLINTSIPADLRYSITDAPGANSYPIAGTDWVLLYVDQPDANKGKVMAYFAWWAVHEGQQYSESLYYAPLPKSIVERSEAQIKRMMCGGAKCFP